MKLNTTLWKRMLLENYYVYQNTIPITAGVKEFFSGECGLASVMWDALRLGEAMILARWLSRTGWVPEDHSHCHTAGEAYVWQWTKTCWLWWKLVQKNECILAAKGAANNRFERKHDTIANPVMILFFDCKHVEICPSPSTNHNPHFIRKPAFCAITN